MCQTKNIGANLWGVNAIVTAIQCKNQLAEDAPDKAFLSPLAFQLQILDDPSQISIATVFHVKVQVLTGFEVLSVVVGDDVGVSEVGEDLELGVQLFSFFL